MGSKLLTSSNLKFARFELKGLDEYLKKIEDAGGNIDRAVEKAVDESIKPIYKDVRQWAEKHKLTGATLKGVARTDVQKEGNTFFAEVGIDTTHSKTAWHAVFVEYGTPKMPADPGIRTAFNNSRIKRIQKQVLLKEGIPVE